MRKMRIVSEGIGTLTRIFDIHGNDITADLSVKEVVWRCRVDEPATVALICEVVEADLIGEEAHG